MAFSQELSESNNLSEVSSSLLNQSISILNPTVKSSPDRIMRESRSPDKRMKGGHKPQIRIDNYTEKDCVIEDG